jgi:DNA-binding NarL/FixJ family response regulator
MAKKKSSSEAPTPAPIRRRLGVILIDPLPVVRAGISLLIDGRPDMEILAEAGEAEAGVRAIGRVRRSRVVVLVGLGLGLEGDHDASWLIRTIRERFPSHAVLAMGANSSPTAVSRALFVGADGFVDKNSDPDAFLSAIRRAAAREMVLEGPASQEVGQIAEVLDARREIDGRLTGREREVLQVAAEGLTAREIAARLGVRERTVTTHLARIYGKLGVGNRVAAVRMATRSGLVGVASSE